MDSLDIKDMTPSQKQARLEREDNKKRLSQWSKHVSPSFLFFSSLPKKNKTMIVNLAKNLSKVTNIHIDRNCYRNTSVCLKWYDDHWMIFYPILLTYSYMGLLQSFSQNPSTFNANATQNDNLNGYNIANPYSDLNNGLYGQSKPIFITESPLYFALTPEEIAAYFEV